MIIGGIRLGLLYLVVWIVSVFWDGGADFYVAVVRQIRAQLPFIAPLNLFLSFAATAILWHLAGFWLWIYTVQLDRKTGEIRPPLPDVPVWYYFGLQFRRATGVLVSSLLALLLALLGLHQLQSLPLVATPFSLVYRVSWLPELGSNLTPWLVYGIVHLCALLIGWVGLRLMSRRYLRPSAGARAAFRQYYARKNPSGRIFAIVVIFAHYPLAVITALTQPHPFHGLLVVCSLLGLLPAALIGQAVGLGVAALDDRWLGSLVRRARKNGPWSPDYRLADSMLLSLTGSGLGFHLKDFVQESPKDGASDFAVPEDGGTGAAQDRGFSGSDDSSERRDAGTVPPPPSPSVVAEAAEQGMKAEKLLAQARTCLENNQTNQIRKARKILGKLVKSSDHRVRQHAREMLENAPPDPRRNSLFFRFIRGTSLAGLACGILVFLALAVQWSTLPDADETRQLARSAHIQVEKKNVNGQSRIGLCGNRFDYSMNTSLENIAEDFQHAVIASEDHRFYERSFAYIPLKFLQATVSCAAKKITGGGACHGNSTVTQQLARNLFLSEERSITRKISELLWALKMEGGLSKDEILDFYMNRIYLGNGNYGAEMGARDYFRKNALDLETSEAAYLAAAIKRPSWNYHQDQSSAVKRGKLILALMKREGYAGQSARLTDSFSPHLGYSTLHKPYLGHLWHWAQGDVAPILDTLPDGKYKVLTTLNAEVQIYAEKALNREISRLKNSGIPAHQGSVVVMRPSGEVLAMVGGVGEEGRYFNRSKRTEGLLARPPASTFKPFVYLAALEKGLTPDSIINARPVSITIPGEKEAYRPANHDGKDYGMIRLRDGLVYSVNTAAVRLLHDTVGFDKLFKTVDKLGIPSATLGRQWGLALGQSGVPLIEMVGAYGVFANGGKAVQPYTVTAITSESGKAIWRRTEEEPKRVFEAAHISKINSMLRDVVRVGTGKHAADSLSRDIVVAGKTGTGDNFVDAWFIGYTSDLVIGVWIGNDTPQPMSGLYGGTGPARVFNDILRKLIAYTDITDGTGFLP